MNPAYDAISNGHSMASLAATIKLKQSGASQSLYKKMIDSVKRKQNVRALS